MCPHIPQKQNVLDLPGVCFALFFCLREDTLCHDIVFSPCTAKLWHAKKALFSHHDTTLERNSDQFYTSKLLFAQ